MDEGFGRRQKFRAGWAGWGPICASYRLGRWMRWLGTALGVDVEEEEEGDSSQQHQLKHDGFHITAALSRLAASVGKKVGGTLEGLSMRGCRDPVALLRQVSLRFRALGPFARLSRLLASRRRSLVPSFLPLPLLRLLLACVCECFCGAASPPQHSSFLISLPSTTASFFRPLPQHTSAPAHLTAF